MVPSNRWFPTLMAERAVWFSNFVAQFTALQVHLGFTVADVTAVSADNDVIQFAYLETAKADDYAAAGRSYRNQITEGNIGDPTPVWPEPPTIVVPPTVATGIFERLDNLVKRIRVAPNYTNDDGLLLGIVPSSPGPTPESELKPSLKPEAMPGSVLLVKFVRGQSDGIELEMQIDASTTWTSAGKFFKSPAQVTIPNKAGDVPSAVRFRARYLQGNDPVGQNSDTVNVTTTP